jgi:hypothetical protein
VRLCSVTRILIAAFALQLAVLVVAPSCPPTASATVRRMTRAQALARAKVWVKRKVRYSREASYQGYRRDCSGMVSMAWGLDRSYTTATIASKAKRIPIGDLRPGDAVLTKGHITLFESWKDRRSRTYVALEQYQTGRPARRVVKRVPRGARALRRRGIAEPGVVATTPAAPATEETTVTASGS